MAAPKAEEQGVDSSKVELLNVCPEPAAEDGAEIPPLRALCASSGVTPVALQAFFDRCPEAAKQPDDSGLYPIHWLCRNQTVTPKLLRTFLTNCPDAASQADSGGYHALHSLCANTAVTAELLEPLLAACPLAASQGSASCSYPLQTLCMNPAITLQALELFLRYCPQAAEQADSVDRYPLHCLCSNPSITKLLLRTLLDQHPKAVKAQDYPVLRLCKNPACTSGLLESLQGYYSEYRVEEDEVFLSELQLQLSQEGPAAANIMNFVCCTRKIEIEHPEMHRTVLRPAGYTLPQTPRVVPRNARLRCTPTVEHDFAEALLPQQRPFEDKFFIRSSVKTCATVMCCQLRGLCSCEIVRALANTPELDALSTSAAQAAVTCAWNRLYWLYIVSMFFDVLVLAFAVDATICMRQGLAARTWEMKVIELHIVVSILAQVRYLFDCIVRRVVDGQEHPAMGAVLGVGEYLRLNSWGAFAMILEALALEVMINVPSLEHIPLLERWYLAGWCGLRWLQLVWGTRTFELFGPRILPIANSVRDTSAFAIILSFCVLSSAHAFYVIGTRADPVNHELHASFVMAYRLGLMGDFDLFDLEENDPYWEMQPHGLEEVEKPPTEYYELVHVWFYISSIFVSLMMTNLLTGILGNNYDRFTELSGPLFLRERARAVARLSSCLLGPARAWAWPKEWAGMDLWMAQRVAPLVDEDRSSRASFGFCVDRLARRPLEAKIDHFEGSLELKVRGMGQRMAGMEAKLDRCLELCESRASL